MQLFIEYPSWLSPVVIPGVPFLRWYSLAYAFGFYFTYLLMRRDIRSGRLPYTEDQLFSLICWSIAGMIVGNRLFYVLFYESNPGYYLARPWLIYWPFRDGRFVGLTGLSYHGAVVGIIAALWLFCRKYKHRFFVWGDASTAALPLGYTLGRLGNFANSELFGRATTVPWGVRFANAEPLPTSLPWVKEMIDKLGLDANALSVNLPRHPSQLYEAFFEGIVLWLLLYCLLRPRNPFPGCIGWCYLIGYGFFRFWLEYLRQPDSNLGYIVELVPGDYRHFVSLANLSMGQLLSLAMVFGGALALLIHYLYHRRHAIQPGSVKT